MRRDRQVANRDASLRGESVATRDTLGGDRHGGVGGYDLAVQQKSILRSSSDCDWDVAFVPHVVSQRKTTRTS